MNTRSLGYSGVQIGLHWTIAALVVFQLLFGESMTTYVRAAAHGRQLSQIDQTMGSAHYWVGLAILFLTFIRLAIRLIYGAPRADISTPKWMALASRTTHLLFYFLLIAVPVSGLLAFYTWDWMGDIHAFAKPVFIVVIGVHAIAAIFHHYVLKDSTLRNMLVPIRNSTP
ncbi:MAG: cytochrome b/b6 domain-containing protein [Hyphomicrobiales bacterium]|nr:cytochrome b/b6 domain-containing protein [Hyphomicrobiales bacterium]